jgi:2-polyprenyl-3-methyl-5-hydroxy-6-metoxy-1,4-benzoquinol methylase
MQLFIVCRSVGENATPQTVSALDGFFAGIGIDPDGALLVLPHGLSLTSPKAVQLVPYPGVLGIESNPQIFSDLRRRQFSRVVLLGSQPLADSMEIVLACYLAADRKSFLDSSGREHDIAALWQPYVRPSFRPREVRATQLVPESQRQYIANIHMWLAEQLRLTGFRRPQPAHERSPGRLLYADHRLSVDLAQQTFDLQVEGHGVSFSTLMLNDGTIVHSADFYRSMANFVAALPDVRSVLDVGCGSGFLGCYLAGSGRFEKVLGVDAALPRVEGARTHASLAGLATVEFRQMSMDRLELPDSSVDVTVSSFALEQSGTSLDRVIAELRRVARKYLILFEPSTEFFPTLASLWHVVQSGWANRYFKVLTDAGVSFAVRPNLLNHYYNPGTVFVVDLQSDRNPVVTLRHLFRSDVQDWPGGLRIEQAAQ